LIVWAHPIPDDQKFFAMLLDGLRSLLLIGAKIADNPFAIRYREVRRLLRARDRAMWPSAMLRLIRPYFIAELAAGEAAEELDILGARQPDAVELV
jgi:hypothetical protein